MIRWLGPHTDVEGLVADAREEGREVHVVNAGPTKEATLAAFAQALDFPAWFGGNLDALADCLGHLARTAPGEWELVVDHAAELARDDPFAFAGLSGLLGEVASSHPRFHVTVVDR
ncbi:MAG TPA: barstar family protein [Ornithinibacter sp.]|nr:barstar family protein [Ornithinibacter sp.]